MKMLISSASPLNLSSKTTNQLSSTSSADSTKTMTDVMNMLLAKQKEAQITQQQQQHPTSHHSNEDNLTMDDDSADNDESDQESTNGQDEKCSVETATTANCMPQLTHNQLVTVQSPTFVQLATIHAQIEHWLKESKQLHEKLANERSEWISLAFIA